MRRQPSVAQTRRAIPPASGGGPEIVMARKLQAFDAAADVPGVGFDSSGKPTPGCALLVLLKTAFAFRLPIRLPDVFDVQHSQHDTFGVTQRNFAAAGLELLANSSVTSEVIGIGQRRPLARRMLWQTLS